MKNTNNDEIEGKSQIKGGVNLEPYYLFVFRLILTLTMGFSFYYITMPLTYRQIQALLFAGIFFMFLTRTKMNKN